MLNKDKKELILGNISIIKHFASKFYIDDFDINYDSLLSRGTKGLLSCADEFNGRSCIKFSSYASNKIKLEILDEIRRTSSFCKGDILQVKNYCEEVLDSFYNNSTDNDDELFNIHFGDSSYNNIKNKCLVSFTAYLDDFLFDSKPIILNELVLNLNKEISNTLSYLEKLVLYLFYKEELNYTQISMVLNVSSDLIFYIHTIGISKVRGLIKKITNQTKEG